MPLRIENKHLSGNFAAITTGVIICVCLPVTKYKYPYLHLIHSWLWTILRYLNTFYKRLLAAPEAFQGFSHWVSSVLHFLGIKYWSSAMRGSCCLNNSVHFNLLVFTLRTKSWKKLIFAMKMQNLAAQKPLFFFFFFISALFCLARAILQWQSQKYLVKYLIISGDTYFFHPSSILSTYRRRARIRVVFLSRIDPV